MRRYTLLAVAFASGAFAASPARADEPMFGYVNTTDLLPKGKWQVETQVTDRARRTEGRSEVDYGLADNLQLTAYLNYGRGSDGATAEAIWRLASPYLSPVGLALLADATRGGDARGGRLRAIVQKNLRDDTVVLAANAFVAFERRSDLPRGAPGRTVATAEFDAGASYRFAPNWSAALEYRHRREQTGHDLSGLRRLVTDMIGPSLHYGGRRWFFTLSALRRIDHDAGWDGLRLRLGRTF